MSWMVKRVEQDLLPHADGWSNPRTYVVYSSASLADAENARTALFAAEARAVANFPEGSVGGYPDAIMFALDYRAPDGPNGPARRLTRKVSFYTTSTEWN